MLRSGELIDHAYLGRYAAELGVDEELQSILDHLGIAPAGTREPDA